MATELFRVSVVRRLENAFDRWLEKPTSYAKKVQSECYLFPEGDLFPYVYVALAYLNLVFLDPAEASSYQQKIQYLVELAEESVIRKATPASGDLLTLQSCRNDLTYIGHLNMLLSVYSLVYGDKEYGGLNRHLTSLIYNDLKKAGARPLHVWPFDTLVALISLRLYDLAHDRSDYREISQQYFNWLEKYCLDPVTRLPFSRLDIQHSYRPEEQPRGCDLSLQLCLLAHTENEYAKQLYRRYVKYFWIQRKIICGFAEWPGGRYKYQDVDSGPVVMGIGMAATGLGIGAVIAMNDRERLGLLMAELSAIDVLRSLFLNAARQDPVFRELHISSEYFSGFLFGDAILFYSITWQPWRKLDHSR